MSTPTPARDALRAPAAVVPQPRPSADPPVESAPGTAPGSEPAPSGYTEPVSIFGRHGWLVPATGIACVIAVFLAMVVLTWAAGGGSPFDR